MEKAYKITYYFIDNNYEDIEISREIPPRRHMAIYQEIGSCVHMIPDDDGMEVELYIKDAKTFMKMYNGGGWNPKPESIKDRFKAYIREEKLWTLGI